jgi:hypothetical protein
MSIEAARFGQEIPEESADIPIQRMAEENLAPSEPERTAGEEMPPALRAFTAAMHESGTPLDTVTPETLPAFTSNALKFVQGVVESTNKKREEDGQRLFTQVDKVRIQKELETIFVQRSLQKEDDTIQRDRVDNMRRRYRDIATQKAGTFPEILLTIGLRGYMQAAENAPAQEGLDLLLAAYGRRFNEAI